VTRLSAESSSFLGHHLADLALNHLVTLVVSMIHSDCHCTMRTGESMQRLKLVARMPCSNTYVLAGVEVFVLTWGPALLKCYGPRVTLIRHWKKYVPVSRKMQNQHMFACFDAVRLFVFVPILLTLKSGFFLRRFRDLIRVSWIRENYDQIPKSEKIGSPESEQSGSY